MSDETNGNSGGDTETTKEVESLDNKAAASAGTEEQKDEQNDNEAAASAGTEEQKDNDAGNGEEESDEESSEEEEKPLPKKRQRKSVARLELTIPEKKVFAVEAGKGMKLRDMEYVMVSIKKIKATDVLVKNLHRLLYNRVGARQTAKRNICDFSGLTDTSDLTTQKLRGKLDNWPAVLVRRSLDLFGVSRSSNDYGGKAPSKGDMIDALINWLKEPTETEKKVPGSTKKRKKAAPKRKRKRKASGTRKRKKVAKKEKETSPSDDSESESSDDEPLFQQAWKPRIKKAMKAVLKDVDKESVTIKGVIKKLAKHFGVERGEMKKHKPFIKATAIALLS